MKIETFEDDCFGLKEFAKRLEQFICVEYEFVEGSLVMGLNSPFGNGKSTFLQMWQNAWFEDREEAPFAISLNAWESDYVGNPLFALISAFKNRLVPDDENLSKINNAIKKIGRFGLDVLLQTIESKVGVDVEEAVKKSNPEKSPTVFAQYEEEKEAMADLKGAIKDCINKDGLKFVFLVDELDRCRPDYAISYLETIKHIFDIKGIVFIIAADRIHLENSAKKAFGCRLNFDEYYRKFVHREAELPQIQKNGFQNLSKAYISYYLEKGKRSSYLDTNSYIRDSYATLFNGFNLTPRQVQEVFRIIGHALSKKPNNDYKLDDEASILVMIMTILRIKNNDMYKLLSQGKAECTEFVKIMRSVINNERILKNIFKLTLFWGGIKVVKDNIIDEYFQCVDLYDPNDSFGDMTFKTYKIYTKNTNENLFLHTYQTIESIKEWD